MCCNRCNALSSIVVDTSCEDICCLERKENLISYLLNKISRNFFHFVVCVCVWKETCFIIKLYDFFSYLLVCIFLISVYISILIANTRLGTRIIHGSCDREHFNVQPYSAYPVKFDFNDTITFTLLRF